MITWNNPPDVHWANINGGTWIKRVRAVLFANLGRYSGEVTRLQLVTRLPLYLGTQNKSSENVVFHYPSPSPGYRV